MQSYCFNLQGGDSYIRIENMTVRYSWDNGIACGNTVGSEFKNLNVYGHRITGIYFLDSGNQNNIVEDCSFANNGHCGIEHTTGSNLVIRRSRFYSTGVAGGGNATHIAFPSTGGAKSDITIENCLFEENGSNLGIIEHAIAIFSTSIDNLVIRHNTFYDWNQNGFTCGSGAGTYTVASNVFHSNNSWRFLAFGGTPTATVDISNNVFYGPTTYGYRWGGTNYSSFADFKTQVAGNGGTVTGNLFQDPQLADVSAYDLRLTAGSPCRDAAPDAGTNDSYDGTVRPIGGGYDIGAYEYDGGAALAVSPTATPDSGTAPLPVQFTANASGGTPPYSYSWDFGDGVGTSALAAPTYTYSSPNIYTATVTVTDTEANTAQGNVVVTVSDPDADSDGLPDAWEIKYFGDTTSYGASDDPDLDDLINGEEFAAGTDPTLADTDSDDLSDYDELNVQGTNPLDSDTDGDGMPDGWEVTYSLDPNSGADASLDADDDGYSNLAEYQAGTDPSDPASFPAGSPTISGVGCTPSGASGLFGLFIAAILVRLGMRRRAR